MLKILLEKWQPLLAVAGFFVFFAWESLEPFFDHRNRLRHVARNLAIAAVNVLVLALGLAGLTVAAVQIAESRGLGLLHAVELPAPVHVGLALLLLDVWTYWWHRANHSIPFLWRFHRMHHSDPRMDVSTATRFHLGEIAISSFLRVSLIPLVGFPIEALLLYDAILLAATQFHHANLGLPCGIDRFLRYVVVSPNMHKVHHSRERAETDSNFSSILSVWDRLFETYRERSNYRSIRFGVEGLDAEECQTLGGLWLTPFFRPVADFTARRLPPESRSA